MRITASIAALSLTAILGCGTSDSDKNKDSNSQDAQQKDLSAEQQAEKEKLAQDLPKGTIMIAEVDKDGNVIGSKMRTVDESVEGKSQEELIRLFSEQGKPIETTVEEADNLDQASSTQSWFGWRHRGNYHCGNRCGGNWSYYHYRPRCHYQGYSYSYQSSARYQVSGYIPAYAMPYQTFQGFREGYREGYSHTAGGAGFAGAAGAGGYQPFYGAGAGYPSYGGYAGSTSRYQVYGWNRGYIQ